MILAVMQARMGSTRLPNKVLMRILEKPMMELQIERISRAKTLDKLVIATTWFEEDKLILDLCERLDIAVVQGSPDDLLDRYYMAARLFNPEHVVRLTADCPLTDPELIDLVVETHIAENNDLTTNVIPPRYPDGLDAEVMSFTALKTAWREAVLPSHREHVTNFFAENPQRFKIGKIVGETDLSNLRWTVDEREDLELVSKIYEELYPADPNFSTSDILTFLETNPKLKAHNSHLIRNEGWLPSLNSDKQWQKSKIMNCLSFQNRAKQRIPGMTMLLSKRPDQFAPGSWPSYYSKASGAEIWDLDGNKYIDMSIGGIGANVLGYADPDVDSAVLKAIKNGSSSSLNCPEEVELSELFCDLHPWAQMCRFTRSGGEAMAVAVRIGRAYSQNDRVAFCGYHGWHDWYLGAAHAKGDLDFHLIPGLNANGVPKCLKGSSVPFIYNDVESLEKVLAENHDKFGVIVMEPIRDEDPIDDFLKHVKELSIKYNCVLIFDEISAAFRFNTGGSHLALGVEPDIAVFSKAIGNGYPIGAVIGRTPVMQAAQDTFISSTTWTERIGSAAAIATINKFCAHNVCRHLVDIGKKVQSGWKEISLKYGVKIDISGIPPMGHFYFLDENPNLLKTVFVEMMIEKGILATNRFYAMYSHTDEHVVEYLKAFEEVFSILKDLQDSDKLGDALLGNQCSSGFVKVL